MTDLEEELKKQLAHQQIEQHGLEANNRLLVSELNNAQQAVHRMGVLCEAQHRRIEELDSENEKVKHVAAGLVQTTTITRELLEKVARKIAEHKCDHPIELPPELLGA